jgi:hypothetical protein
MSSLLANVGAVNSSYFNLSGARVNLSIDSNFPLFTSNMGIAGVTSDYAAVIAPYSKNADGSFKLDSTSLTPMTTAAEWAYIPVAKLPLLVSYVTVNTAGSTTVPVYFASQFSGSTASPTTGTLDKNNWTVYLSMASSGPYNLVFNAAETNGAIAQVGKLPVNMEANGWSLASANDKTNNITLSYTPGPGVTTPQFVPCLTLKRDNNSDSIAYMCVVSCEGFGIQAITTYSFPVTQPDFSGQGGGGGGGSGPGSDCPATPSTTTTTAGVSDLAIGFIVATVILIIAVIVLSVELKKRWGSSLVPLKPVAAAAPTLRSK